MYRGHSRSLELRERALRTIPWATQTGSKKPVTLFDSEDRPSFIQRGEGAVLTDVDGNQYIDYVMSLGPILLGHRHPAVEEAIRRQLHDGLLFSAASPLEVEAAEILCRLMPGAEWVRFFKGGAEACSAAIRVARAHTGREHIATCGYFGWHDNVSGGPGVPEGIKALRHEFTWGDAESLEAVLKAHPGQVAAVMLEPFIITEAPEFLARCRELAHSYGALFILDEIKTGLRFGKSGGQGRYGVIPDLTVMGKAIGNGMPISALAGLNHVRPTMESLWISGTYNGDCLSLAACRAVLETVEREDPSQAIWQRGERLVSGIRQAIAELKAPARYLGVPALSLMEFTHEDREVARAMEREFVWTALQQGVWFKRGAYNFVCAAHTDEQIEQSVAVARQALAAAMEAAR